LDLWVRISFSRGVRGIPLLGGAGVFPSWKGLGVGFFPSEEGTTYPY